MTEATQHDRPLITSLSAPPAGEDGKEHLPPRGEWLRLNVGGVVFTTTRTTLCSYPQSMLACLFGSTWNEDSVAKDESGAYYLDADPTYFRVILNYLRRGKVLLDGDVSVDGVIAEAKYFGLHDIVQQLQRDQQHQLHMGAHLLSWEDVGGLSGVKKELQQMVDQAVKYKSTFEQWGVSSSKNILLYGPPGCGKTLLARVTANEIKANFVWVKCPELLTLKEETNAVLEAKFREAKANEPCIVFLEEFECIACVRGMNVVNAGLISHLAILLDSVTTGPECVFVFAATNRPDVIEPALLRPGRFDQLIYIPMPDTQARHEILRAALRKVPVCENIDLQYLAEHSRGLSGADLKEICQRACKFAIRQSLDEGCEIELRRSHLEVAMSYARVSVSESELYKYETFNKMLRKMSRQNTFSFPLDDRDEDQEELADPAPLD